MVNVAFNVNEKVNFLKFCRSLNCCILKLYSRNFISFVQNMYL